jgi:hypothetical protein
MNLVKVFFVQAIGEGQLETESLWCIKEGQIFEVNNIPFIARRIALGDKILAEFDPEEKVYYFDDFVDVSGNSTLRVYFSEPKLIDETVERLNSLGCESEILLQRQILAVNVPKNVDYLPIKHYLDEGENKKLWTYEESCLAHQY